MSTFTFIIILGFLMIIGGGTYAAVHPSETQQNQ